MRKFGPHSGAVVVATALASMSLSVGSLAGSSPAYADMAPVGLGTAGSYGVLAGTTVTNTGPALINGDLGVSPGTAITGFPPGVVSGAVHGSDAPAAQAQSDLVTAYNAAAGLAPTAIVSGDLGGQTLTAGVYKSPSAIGLTGTLTLGGQGDPGAVFVFQFTSTLVTASASHVVLINGAQPGDVFWQVGSSAILGTQSSFAGTIMALTSISITMGTSVQGGALARNGQVILDDNNITVPTVTAAPTVTGLSPTSGPAAGTTLVTLTGTGFIGSTAVDFGTNAAVAFSVVNDTTIDADSPAGTGTVDVTVTTPAGTSATSPADQFDLNRHIVGIAATPDGKGYWLVGANGMVSAFGDAKFFGSLPATESTVIVGIVADANIGYRLITAQGNAVRSGAPLPDE